MVAVNIRVQKHRDALRQAGLRPVQIWVPDTRPADFAKECERQVNLVAVADQFDSEALDALMNESLADIEGWTA
ncbi:MAG: antitoxin MazE family protein [Burkholderiales bacterium]|nr:antitoxin MazE family protein [Burkholderiales bacterium]